MDAVGVETGLKGLTASGLKAAKWIQEMLDAGITSFYRLQNAVRQYYDVASKSYKDIPGQEKLVVLSNIGADKVLWKNSGTTIKDLGDGILNIEFHTKMNTIGGEVLQGLNKAMDMAEKDYRGLIISNEGQNF